MRSRMRNHLNRRQRTHVVTRRGSGYWAAKRERARSLFATGSLAVGEVLWQAPARALPASATFAPSPRPFTESTSSLFLFCLLAILSLSYSSLRHLMPPKHLLSVSKFKSLVLSLASARPSGRGLVTPSRSLFVMCVPDEPYCLDRNFSRASRAKPSSMTFKFFTTAGIKGLLRSVVSRCAC